MKSTHGYCAKSPGGHLLPETISSSRAGSVKEARLRLEAGDFGPFYIWQLRNAWRAARRHGWSVVRIEIKECP